MTEEPERINYIRMPKLVELSHACEIVSRAIGESCYLVGSATRTSDYNDVDVRVSMRDEKFQKIFGEKGHYQAPFWSLFCASVSHYLSALTGLPVDFQVQPTSEFGGRYRGMRRTPLSHGVNVFEGPPWNAEPGPIQPPEEGRG